jgi:hypothetical protein
MYLISMRSPLDFIIKPVQVVSCSSFDISGVKLVNLSYAIAYYDNIFSSKMQNAIFTLF